ncbi:MAG: ribosome biogenesis protein [Thermoplasmata archaeon]|nr:ribosome biogenesis protein [Candidatus Sysuiplasma acidicola]MBX8638250.1 ribosome biogenesis protein [Candidatus Sysuiplasma acidicola]MBX8646883.1 ribosome biogenesis protein [Candidatus Sysuiplasma acidicola]
MRSIILKCPACGVYTMSEICRNDGQKTKSSIPMRFTPDDRYAKYRRALMEQSVKEE